QPAPGAVPSAPASSAWHVHEAPASACFRCRVGAMELLYTLRGVDDAELQRRMTATLPTVQEIIAACEARAAQRTAERETAQAFQTASTPTDLEARIQQAVQQALVAQAVRQGTAANGTAASTPPAPPSTPPEAPAGD